MTDALSDVMIAKRITREELAKLSRLSHATLDRLLAGRGQARRVTRRRLGEALGESDEQVDLMLKAQRRVRKRSPQRRVLHTAAAICREAAAKTGDPIAASCHAELLRLLETLYPVKKIKLRYKKRRNAD